MGSRYESLGDDLILVELGLLAVMVIKVEIGNNGNIITINDNNNISRLINNNNKTNSTTSSSSTIAKDHHLQTNTYLTKIKKTLLTQSNKSYLHLGK